jgi:pimeloyl-ACP methyl ester carboxylesterase
MGAFVAASAAAEDPDRYRALVLVDGGLGFPGPTGENVDAMLAAVIGPAMTRLSMVFDSPEDHLAFWRRHPAVGPLLAGPGGLWLKRYLDHDLVETPEGWRSSCVLDAVRADGRDVLADPDTLSAAHRAVEQGVDTQLLWAERGLLDEPQGLYDEARLRALALPDVLRTTPVPDTNHYSVILDAAPVRTLADALDAQLATRGRSRSASWRSRARSVDCQPSPTSRVIRSSRWATVLVCTCRLVAACRGLDPARK